MRRVRDEGRGIAGMFGRGGPDTLELFAGTDYSGQRKEITGAVASFRDIDFNDRAISVRVPAGQSWELCVNVNFDDCRVVNASMPDLNVIGLRRVVSSARPRQFGRGGGGGFPPGQVRVRIIMFDRVNFTGNSITLDDAQPTLGGFNNRAQSLQVIGGRWEICDSQRYRGRCETVTGNIRDLRSLKLDNRVESARPR